MNPYRLWHQCLQFVPLKMWAKHVRRDLGSAQRLSFDDWWADVSDLLEELEPEPVRVIDTKEEAKKFSLWESEGDAVLLVNLSYPTKTLMEEIERRLRALQKNKRGRPARESLAEYPLTRKPNVRQIELLLRVYQCREVDGMSLIETCKKLKLAPQANATDAAGRNVMSATTSRYLRRAQALIFNASQGVFPSY